MILTIIIGAIATFIFGAIWFTFLFGRTWAKLMGFNEPGGASEGEMGMVKPMIMNFIANLVVAFSLYQIFPTVMASEVSGYKTLFFIWLGFSFSIYANAAIWERKSWKLVAINSAYSLISLVILSAVFYYMM